MMKRSRISLSQRECKAQDANKIKIAKNLALILLMGGG